LFLILIKNTIILANGVTRGLSQGGGKFG